MTAAERQAKCRAIKKGTWQCLPGYSSEREAMEAAAKHLGLPAPQKQTPALSAPAPSQQPALPAPSSSATQKSLPSNSTSLALFEGEQSGDGPRFCLPAGVAARLRSLLDKHKAGKHLTAAERLEAEGLLDIAEYFVVQRMRRSLAA